VTVLVVVVVVVVAVPPPVEVPVVPAPPAPPCALVVVVVVVVVPSPPWPDAPPAPGVDVVAVVTTCFGERLREVPDASPHAPANAATPRTSHPNAKLRRAAIIDASERGSVHRSARRRVGARCGARAAHDRARVVRSWATAPARPPSRGAGRVRAEEDVVRSLFSLVEARIVAAERRGDLSGLANAGKPLAPDPIDALPRDARLEAMLARMGGAAPEEVALLRAVEADEAALEAATSDEERRAIRLRLRASRLRLSVLFEAAGRREMAAALARGER
jgi:hypothetical protein